MVEENKIFILSKGFDLAHSFKTKFLDLLILTSKKLFFMK